jgi:hypothetical protein
MARTILGIAALATVWSHIAAEIPLGAAGSEERALAGEAGMMINKCVRY